MNHQKRACARPGSVMILAIFLFNFLRLLPLVLLLDPSDVLARRSTSCQRPAKFDEARFALQWSPGICFNIINKSCVVNVDKFTIHGLWPSKIGGNDPQNCCNKPFDPKLIRHLEPKLKEIWVTIFADNENRNFWNHEWKKHGSCGSSSPHLTNQTEYFAKSIELYEKLPLMKWLEDAQIKPVPASTGVSYAIKDIHTAIESHISSRIALDCKRLPRGISQEPILTGVYVCLDGENLQPVDCSKDDKAQCGNGKVKFLSNSFAPVSSSARSVMLNK